MIENRRYITLVYGNGDILHKVILDSVPCSSKSEEARYVQYELFRMLHFTPDLLNCGPYLFETFNMKHDGMKWVVTLTALQLKE